MNRLNLPLAMAAAVALVAALGLAACSATSSPGSSGASDASGSSGASGASSAAGGSQASAASSGETTRIGLDYNAGTGYEWVAAAEPEDVVEQVGDIETEAQYDDDRVGGPLRDYFTFRGVAPGEVVLTFTLERPWEPGDAAETQIYAFTVGDDLRMVLNPYKSDFENAPE